MTNKFYQSRLLEIWPSSIYFGDENQATWDLWIDRLILYYGSSHSIETRAGQEPLILDDLALPFKFGLEVLQTKDYTINLPHVTF